MADTTRSAGQNSARSENVTNNYNDRAALLPIPRTRTRDIWELYETQSRQYCCSCVKHGLNGNCVLRCLTLIGGIFTIVIGAIYIDECPIDRKLPIWLIVSGAITIFMALLNCLLSCTTLPDEPTGFTTLESAEETSEKMARLKQQAPFTAASGITQLTWLIVGSIWFFSCYSKISDDPHSANYCTQSVYVVIYVMLIAEYVLMGIFIVMFTCICCLACCVFCLTLLVVDEDEIRRFNAGSA